MTPSAARRKRQLTATLKTSREIREAQEKDFNAAVGDPLPFIDQFNTQRRPTMTELIRQYKGFVYSCSTTNAQAVARVPMRLFVQTPKGTPEPKYWPTKKLNPGHEKWVRTRARTFGVRADSDIREVTVHPLLDLIEGESSYFGVYGLREFTDLYQETGGEAYWWIEKNTLGVPARIWLLQPQHVQVMRDMDTGLPVSFKYGRGTHKREFPAADVVDFRFPNLHDPYGAGWSPARAVWEAINIMNKDHSFVAAAMDNRVRPDAIVSPKDETSALGPGQFKRLEATLNRKYRKGGVGGLLVWDSALNMQPLSFKAKDMEMLARFDVTKVEILNAYGIPPALFDSMKSRAELDAAQAQHGRQAVSPRLLRMDERINQKLTVMYSNRLFVVSDDPVPEDMKSKIKVRESNLKTGVRVINEERLEEGNAAVAWGNEPWYPGHFVQPSSAPTGELLTPPPVEDPEGEEEEKFYSDVLTAVRQHPEGIDLYDIATELGKDISMGDVGQAVRYWQAEGLIN